MLKDAEVQLTSKHNLLNCYLKISKLGLYKILNRASAR